MTKSANALRTIGEAAIELDVEPHVLRYWERRFSQLQPVRRRNRRYFEPKSMALLRVIQHLLHTERYTIDGVKKLLARESAQSLVARIAVPQRGNAVLGSNAEAGTPTLTAAPPSEHKAASDVVSGAASDVAAGSSHASLVASTVKQPSVGTSPATSPKAQAALRQLRAMLSEAVNQNQAALERLEA